MKIVDRAVAAAPVSSTTYSSVAGAVTGVVMWALSAFVFHSHVIPAELQGALWVLVPAAVTGFASRFTRRSVTQAPVDVPPKGLQ